jgi:hypothetical protein
MRRGRAAPARNHRGTGQQGPRRTPAHVRTRAVACVRRAGQGHSQYGLSTRRRATGSGPRHMPGDQFPCQLGCSSLLPQEAAGQSPNTPRLTGPVRDPSARSRCTGRGGRYGPTWLPAARRPHHYLAPVEECPHHQDPATYAFIVLTASGHLSRFSRAYGPQAVWIEGF